MPQDAFTLKYLCIELNNVFASGKVNRIVQPDNDEVIFTVYNGKKTERLLLNVNPASPRIGIISAERESPLTAPNFCMLLRKHLSAATLDGISLVGFDRIVKIDFTASGEFFDAVKKTLYVELMGRYSNVILTENGKILGGNRGINMFDDGVRPLIVGKPYVFPPVNGKKIPDDISLIQYYSDYNGGGAAEYICAGVQGLAVSTAREAVLAFSDKIGVGYEECDKNFAHYASEFFQFFNEFLFNAKPAPCVIKENGLVKDVCLFPYRLIKGEVVSFEKLYLAEDCYYTERTRAKKFNEKRERLKSIISAALKKVKKRLTAINAKEKDASDAEDNRIKGELIISNIYRIKRGEESCSLENYYDGGAITDIKLDPRLSPSENAQAYYKKYNKKKRTIEAILPQKEQAENELNYLESISDELSLTENIDDVNMVYAEARAAGLVNDRNPVRKEKEQTSFCRVYKIGDYIVKAGRNNTENDRLVIAAKPESMWFHAKDYHSSHVVIEYGGKNFTEDIIVKAAEICAYYSKGREGGKTEIAYTLKKNLKKPKKAKAGLWVYDNYKTVLVKADAHKEFLIENRV